MADDVVDGYWIRIGKLAVEALSDILRSDLTTRRREIIAEYLGGIFDNAYRMGIRAGEFSARLEARRPEGDSE